MRRSPGPVVATAIGTSLLLSGSLSGCMVVTGDGVGSAVDRGGSGAVEAAAVRTVEEFWSEALPELYGRPYRPLDRDRIVPFTGRSREVLTCGGQFLSYREVANNAFAAPCPDGITVAWDAAQLFPRLVRSFGEVAPAVVLAHEWGHVAQFQAGIRLPTVYAEQQADCWAGAWTAAVAAAPPEPLAELADETGLDGALATVVSVRDPVGMDPSQEGAHGSGFDRVRAFQEGYERGAAPCAAYAESPPTLVEFPFRTIEEAQSGGNSPLEQLLPLVTADLDAFYTARVPGFSPLGTFGVESLSGDDRRVLERLAVAGDSAPVTYLALRWAAAAQAAGRSDQGLAEGEGPALQRACFTGGWLATLLAGTPASGELRLSPGDLDESILGLLALARGRAPEAGGGEATGFELVADFRQGVLQGFRSCARP